MIQQELFGISGAQTEREPGVQEALGRIHAIVERVPFKSLYTSACEQKGESNKSTKQRSDGLVVQIHNK